MGAAVGQAFEPDGVVSELQCHGHMPDTESRRIQILVEAIQAKLSNQPELTNPFKLRSILLVISRVTWPRLDKLSVHKSMHSESLNRKLSFRKLTLKIRHVRKNYRCLESNQATTLVALHRRNEFAKDRSRRILPVIKMHASDFHWSPFTNSRPQFAIISDEAALQSSVRKECLSLTEPRSPCSRHHN